MIDFSNSSLRSSSARASRMQPIIMPRISVLTSGTENSREETSTCNYNYKRRSRHTRAKPRKSFFTGSSYEGGWNQVGFAGKGLYKFPHGVIYEGWFNRAGQFHGGGTLYYPNGFKLEVCTTLTASSEQSCTKRKAHYPSSQTKPRQTFITGSSYEGAWNQVGFAGKGHYKFPHGVIYEGWFNRAGQFHGGGTLYYPNGFKLEGYWQNGTLTGDTSYLDSKDRVRSPDYCRVPDRRFEVEIDEGLPPATQEHLTNSFGDPPKIPSGCYDTGFGFYNPTNHCVIDYGSEKVTHLTQCSDLADPELWTNMTQTMDNSDSTSIWSYYDDPGADNLSRHEPIEVHTSLGIKSMPAKQMDKWIKANCRKAWDEPTGCNPDLFEFWTYGMPTEESLQQDLSLEKKLSELDEELEDIVIKELPHVLKNRYAKEKDADSILRSITKLFAQNATAFPRRRMASEAIIKKPITRSSDHELVKISEMFGVVSKTRVVYDCDEDEVNPVCRLKVSFLSVLDV